MISAWPRPADVLEHHRRMVEALRLLGRHVVSVTTDGASAFFGMTVDELDEALERAREELDEQVVLALVASAEATLRVDFDERLRRKTKCELRPRFRALRDEHADKVRLDSVLDAWVEASAGVEAVGRLRQLVKRRHWLAHGRYWTDKSGIAPDPEQAQLAIDAAFDAMRGVEATFPLG